MKKAIGGKQYNTETAECLGSFEKGLVGEVDWIKEELFRKKTGEYFLYGTGGTMTRYAVVSSQGGNNFTGSSKIMPLTLPEAQKWAEKNLTGDEYEAIFGEIEEDDSKQAKIFSLRKDTIAKIGRMTAERGLTSASALIELLVNEEKLTDNSD